MLTTITKQKYSWWAKLAFLCIIIFPIVGGVMLSQSINMVVDCEKFNGTCGLPTSFQYVFCVDTCHKDAAKKALVSYVMFALTAISILVSFCACCCGKKTETQQNFVNMSWQQPQIPMQQMPIQQQMSIQQQLPMTQQMPISVNKM